MCGSQVQVGRPAPPFARTAVVDGRLKEVTLSAYTEANHWVILVFFPKAWSFICPTEIKAFSGRLEEFLYSRSCAVVFASTDSEHCLKAWNGTSDMEGGLGGVHIPLISDCDHRMSRDYGVLIKEQGVSQRALFIIDPKGIVRSITVNDADVGRSVDETLRVLDALAFKDEFGEGCPIDWKKGDKGIEIASKNRVEGSVELKKSWSEWARPKLNRAWSAASQKSISSHTSHSNTPLPASRRRAESNELLPSVTSGGSGHASQLSSGQASPMMHNGPMSPFFSPTSVANNGMQSQMDKALSQQRFENMQAAMQNQNMNLGQGIGLAN
ncbi:cTPxI [Saxophila tyrrhenica]|uniref:CTPxI n=1 Tax=Saxophila tyrrhenica TaxID=1690608 RepID=A0AAV9PE32_9PEZI|nr:cTPxI [Saxophila tyrrhenica]